MPDSTFADFVVEQLRDAGQVHARAMFGGFTVYCEGKPVGLICNDQLFVKPTEEGKRYIGEVEEAPPYNGAKPYFLIQEQIEDREWLTGLIAITYAALPEKKAARSPRTPRGQKRRL
jgi:TfoX/Sxy family transcriptional regulator of competence genes